MFTTPIPGVTPVGAVAGSKGVASSVDSPAPPAPQPSTPSTSQQGDASGPSLPQPSPLKLVVAKAEASLAYSYSLVDQITGRVVVEIPHQAAKDAAASPSYTAGGVVDTVA